VEGNVHTSVYMHGPVRLRMTESHVRLLSRGASTRLGGVQVSGTRTR